MEILLSPVLDVQRRKGHHIWWYRKSKKGRCIIILCSESSLCLLFNVILKTGIRILRIKMDWCSIIYFHVLFMVINLTFYQDHHHNQRKEVHGRKCGNPFFSRLGCGWLITHLTKSSLCSLFNVLQKYKFAYYG